MKRLLSLKEDMKIKKEIEFRSNFFRFLLCSRVRNSRILFISTLESSLERSSGAHHGWPLAAAAAEARVGVVPVDPSAIAQTLALHLNLLLTYIGLIYPYIDVFQAPKAIEDDENALKRIRNSPLLRGR